MHNVREHLEYKTVYGSPYLAASIYLSVHVSVMVVDVYNRGGGFWGDSVALLASSP